MFLVIAVLVLYRYYAKQREDFNKVFVTLREDVAQDALSIYSAGINFGQRSRDLYQEYSPKAVELINAAKSAYQERFGAAAA